MFDYAVQELEIDDTCLDVDQAFETVALCDPICFHTSKKEVVDVERLFSLCNIENKSEFLDNFKNRYFSQLEYHLNGNENDKYSSRDQGELQDYVSVTGKTTYFLAIKELLKLVPLQYKQNVTTLLLECSCCDYAKREVNDAVPKYLLLVSKFLSFNT